MTPDNHGNLQDFTRIGSPAAAREETVLRKTYTLLAVSFLPCIAGAALGMQFNPFAFLPNIWLAVIILFAFFYGMCFAIEKNRYSNTGIALLMVFTFGMGVMLSPLLQVAFKGFANGGKLVVLAAAMTAAVFFAMAFFARRTKADMNALGRFLTVGAVVLMVGVVANLFLQVSALSLTLSAGFVIFSSLLIMWQIRTVIDGGEDSYISAALTIFVSLYNIFSSILRLLLAFAGEE